MAFLTTPEKGNVDFFNPYGILFQDQKSKQCMLNYTHHSDLFVRSVEKKNYELI